MRFRIKGYLGVGLVCLFYWCLDSIWAYMSFEYNLKKLIFSEPGSYLDTFLLQVSPYQVVSRLMVVCLFALLGILAIEFFVRKQSAQREIRESEEKFRTVVTHMEEILWMTDGEGCFILSQGKGLAALGMAPDEAVGQSVFDMYRDNPAVIEAVNRALAGESFTSEVETGGQCFRSWYTPRKDKYGRIIGVLGLSVNITEQKQAEQALKKLEQQLMQSRKMESIGNLAGGIAHDFNNILSSVIGYTELALEDTDRDSLVAENLREVYAAGKRAKELVKNILVFARKSDEEIKPIQVGSIVEEALRFIRSSIPTTIEIQKKISTDSLIMGNATQIHQVMMNLCTNAAQAMETRGGILDVGLRDVALGAGDLDKGILYDNPAPGPGEYVELRVSDTGDGIPGEIMDAVFEPYFTTKGPGEGTGMGLAVVHGIVEAHGGKISVESQPGSGATFLVHLPVTKRRNLPPAYEAGALPGGTERILFVDDEAGIVKMSERALSRLGYTVTPETDSLSALERFRARPDGFDMLITDMTMPGMTGAQLAGEVTKLHPGLPVILCTGYNKNLSDKTASKSGIKTILYKPVIKADLANTVRKVLDGMVD